jgi:hypothetical protein
VGAVQIEAASTNTGLCFISDSVANMTAGIKSQLPPGAAVGYNVENDPENEDHTYLSLQDLFFDGNTVGDYLIVNYLEQVSVVY